MYINAFLKMYWEYWKKNYKTVVKTLKLTAFFSGMKRGWAEEGGK